jgi:hypothetical protein
VDYLLGTLPEDETERLDELSITDDEFAWRLNAVENDLVDAYVRGELPPETRERFQAGYLSSEERREKVTFAEAFMSRKTANVAAAKNARNVPLWSVVLFRRWQWAATSLLVLATLGFLFYENWRLRNELARQTAATSAALERTHDLERLRDAGAGGLSEAPPKRSPQQKLKTAAFFLVAQTRDANSVDMIAIPGGTDRVIFHLELESDDFPAYVATVRDPVTNQLVWRGSYLKSEPRPQGRVVSISLSRALLKPQHYTVELTGVSAAGASPFAGSYAFRVME